MDFDISTGEVVDSDLDSVEIFTDNSDQEEDEVTKRTGSTSKGVMMANSGYLWSCDICGKVVSSRSNLKRHTRTLHQTCPSNNNLCSNNSEETKIVVIF